MRKIIYGDNEYRVWWEHGKDWFVRPVARTRSVLNSGMDRVQREFTICKIAEVPRGKTIEEGGRICARAVVRRYYKDTPNRKKALAPSLGRAIRAIKDVQLRDAIWDAFVHRADEVVPKLRQLPDAPKEG